MAYKNRHRYFTTHFDSAIPHVDAVFLIKPMRSCYVKLALEINMRKIISFALKHVFYLFYCSKAPFKIGFVDSPLPKLTPSPISRGTQCSFLPPPALTAPFTNSLFPSPHSSF